ncbi:MAG: glycosyltransferase family 2 protein [Thermofilum sp.]|jgi:GT2 family glycosyltransferase|nr:glycosyltransferase family 2 protein [Thermofilum sp.]
MRVSVIIPTYNRRKDLAELFESLLVQTYKPVEVIIVDDTPNDEIKMLCEEYKPRFKESNINLIYIRNHKKKSLTVARNIGIENACGDILLFLDNDVILFNDYIEKLIEIFKEKKQALCVQGYIVNISIRKDKLSFLRDLFNRVFHSYYRYPEDSCKLFEYPSSLSKVIECEWLSGANFACKREVFNELKFDENLEGYSFMEDVLFSHTLYKKYPGTLFITPYAKCIHKSSPKNYTDKNALEKLKLKQRKYVLRKLFGFKGILFYYWQNIGIMLLNFINSIKKLGFKKVKKFLI